MRKQQDISSKRNHAEQATEPNPQRFPKCTGNAEFAAGDGCRDDKQSQRAHGKRDERRGKRRASRRAKARINQGLNGQNESGDNA